MILTIDGRLIPPACRHCHVNSARENGICWRCTERGCPPKGGQFKEGEHPNERKQIEAARAKVREMRLGR